MFSRGAGHVLVLPQQRSQTTDKTAVQAAVRVSVSWPLARSQRKLQGRVVTGGPVIHQSEHPQKNQNPTIASFPRPLTCQSTDLGVYTFPESLITDRSPMLGYPGGGCDRSIWSTINVTALWLSGSWYIWKVLLITALLAFSESCVRGRISRQNKVPESRIGSYQDRTSKPNNIISKYESQS